MGPTLEAGVARRIPPRGELVHWIAAARAKLATMRVAIGSSLGIVGLALACARPPAPALDPSPPKSSEDQPAVVVEDDGARGSNTPRFWISGAGLRAYDFDGAQLATLSEFGDYARRLPDGRVVLVGGGEAGGESAELLVLDDQGAVALRQALPNGLDLDDCSVDDYGEADHPEAWPLHLQEAAGFRVDAKTGRACLMLQDRNINMADFVVSVSIELEGGGIASEVELDATESCASFDTEPESICPDAERGVPWVEFADAPENEPSEDSWAFHYDDERKRLIGAEGEGPLLCEAGAKPDSDDWAACSMSESRSPSGRWELLIGRWESGDYIYRELALLDRETGALFQFHEQGEGTKMVEVEAPAIFAVEGPGVLAVVGESDYGWLPEDRLWVDGRLIIPARREIVEIGGRRARALTAE